MSGTVAFATRAALGALVVGLLAVGAGASGDELTDLRANNQLLQQRLDQLSQTPAKSDPAPGTRPTTGSFPRSFLIPGTDTSLRIGGSVAGTVQYSR